MLPDIESPYYWVRNLISMLVWLLCLAAALFGILWVAQHIGGEVLPLDGRRAATIEAARSAAMAGDHRMAIEHFSQAISGDDSKTDLWIGRANSRLAVGDAQGALDDAAAAVARGVPENEVLLMRAKAYQMLRKPDQAIVELDRIIANGPGSSEARRVRASLYAEGGSFDKALADLDSIIAGNPDDPNANLLRAEIGLRSGDWRAAASSFIKLTRISNNEAKPWVGVGVALLGSGGDAEALTAFEKALKIQSAGPYVRVAALLGQAIALRRLGRHDEAINAWNVYAAISRAQVAPALPAVNVDAKFLQRLYFEIASRSARDDGFVPTSREAAPEVAPDP